MLVEEFSDFVTQLEIEKYQHLQVTKSLFVPAQMLILELQYHLHVPSHFVSTTPNVFIGKLDAKFLLE
jgi:hypothetical protein